MNVRKICRKILRTGSSPGGKTLLKIELFKKETTVKHASLRPFEGLKLEAITFIVTHKTCLAER